MTIPAWLLGLLAVSAVAGTFLTMFAKIEKVPERRRAHFDALGDALLGMGVSTTLVAFAYDAGYKKDPTSQVVFWGIVVVLMAAAFGLYWYSRPRTP